MKQKKFIRSNPHLPVRDLHQTLQYYREKLGFQEEWTFGDKDGGISRDDMRLLFAEDPDYVARLNDQGHRLPLVWFVDNIEAVYEEFRERGIKPAAPLQIQPYGLREFAFIDINGYYVRVAEGAE
jgi:uncharacterized glyoxalase superfamily protein PhnB